MLRNMIDRVAQHAMLRNMIDRVWAPLVLSSFLPLQWVVVHNTVGLITKDILIMKLGGEYTLGIHSFKAFLFIFIYS
jgi:hypothetical protein